MIRGGLAECGTGSSRYLLGEIVETTPRRFEELITDAIAVESGHEAASFVSQTMISASIGLKHQAPSREFYLERLKVAIGLLVG